MRRVALNDAPAGTTLARDVPGPQPIGPPLLCAGMALDPAVLARAAASGVTAVWIDDELGAGIDLPPQLDPGVRATVLRTVDRIFSAARRASQSRSQLDMGVLTDAQRAAGLLVAEVRRGVRDDGEAPADPLGHHHALRVAVLGLTLGLTLLAESPDRHGDDRLDERLTLFGAGLLMHDVGRGMAGGRAAPESRAGVGDHAREAVAAEALMPASLYPLQVRSVVRSHREHWDGSGSPDRKAGTAVHLLARIAAVADAYDTLTTGQDGDRAVPTCVAVCEIEAAAGTRFDPTVVEAFSELVLPYPPGCPVMLADGGEAVVIDAQRATRLRPLVRVRAGDGAEEFITDLTEQFSPALLSAGHAAY